MFWGSTHSDPPKRSRFTRTVATTRAEPEREPTRLGAITGRNTRARPWLWRTGREGLQRHPDVLVMGSLRRHALTCMRATTAAAIVMLTAAAPAAAAAESTREEPERVVGLVTWKDYRAHDYEGWLRLPTGPECWRLNVATIENGWQLDGRSICVTEQVWRATPRWSHFDGVPLREAGEMPW